MGKQGSDEGGAQPDGAAARSVKRPECLGVRSHFRRLIEIEQALTELAPLFRESGRQLAGAGNAAARGDALAEYVSRVRLAGFFAYGMAREGIELLRLTAAAAGLDQAGSDPAGSTRTGAAEEADRALRHLEEVGPLLQQTLRDMEPYRELDSARTLEKIAARLAGGQRPPSGG